MPKDTIREELAAIEHQRWADWQKYVHSKGIRDSSGIRLTINHIEHWERQINTPYSELTEAEKQSDREQVDRYWPLIEKYIEAHYSDIAKKIEGMKKTEGISERDIDITAVSFYNHAIDDIKKLLSPSSDNKQQI